MPHCENPYYPENLAYMSVKTCPYWDSYNGCKVNAFRPNKWGWCLRNEDCTLGWTDKTPWEKGTGYFKTPLPEK
jgi:hypothetical protein